MMVKSKTIKSFSIIEYRVYRSHTAPMATLNTDTSYGIKTTTAYKTATELAGIQGTRCLTDIADSF